MSDTVHVFEVLLVDFLKHLRMINGANSLDRLMARDYLACLPQYTMSHDIFLEEIPATAMAVGANRSKVFVTGSVLTQDSALVTVDDLEYFLRFDSATEAVAFRLERAWVS